MSFYVPRQMTLKVQSSKIFDSINQSSLRAKIKNTRKGGDGNTD